MDKVSNLDKFVDLVAQQNFESALVAFLAHCQKLCDEYTKNSRLQYSISYETGPKYVRVIRSDVGATSGSVHCFVERSTGNVLYPASYAAPQKKTPRGNIYTPDAYGVNHYGANRLR